MKSTKTLVLLAFSILMVLSSCDDDSNNKVENNTTNNINPNLPSPEDCEISSTEVLYNKDLLRLYTVVEVTVRNGEGTPMPFHSVRIGIYHDMNGDPIVENEEAVSDEFGIASFEVSSVYLGIATVTAQVSTSSDFISGETLDIPHSYEIPFDYSVSIIPIESTFFHDHGEYNLRFTVTDELYSITEAELNLTNEIENSTISDSSFITDLNGRFNVDYSTPVAGIQNFITQLEGMEDSKESVVDLSGPVISGSIANMQHYPLGFYSARVGVFTLNINSEGEIDPEDPVGTELVSESTCPCPGPAEYELILPITPVDTENVVEENISRGFYVVMVYDDLNDNHILDEGEYLLGVNTSTGILMFEAPGSSSAENPGWSIVNGWTSDRQVLDWSIFSDSVNVNITRSPVYHPTVRAVFDTGDTEYNMAFMVVPSSAEVIDDPVYTDTDDIENLVSQGIIFHDEQTTVADYEFTLTDVDAVVSSQLIDQMSFNYTDDSGNLINVVRVLPFLYTDDDDSGNYTEGDEISAISGYGSETDAFFLWVVDHDDNLLFMNPSQIYFHRGFMPIARSARAEIYSTFVDGSDYNYEIRPWLGRELNSTFTATRDGTTIAEGSISNGLTPTSIAVVPSSGCSGCADISIGDKIVITGELSPGELSVEDFFVVRFRSIQ
ncbi:MAG: hypothetical protein JXR95_13265 [Deltaproteobacteria bacterium]|nr:hypothetical protein [Deltaproteobacteria bacterium]